MFRISGKVTMSAWKDANVFVELFRNYPARGYTSILNHFSYNNLNECYINKVNNNWNAFGDIKVTSMKFLTTGGTWRGENTNSRTDFNETNPDVILCVKSNINTMISVEYFGSYFQEEFTNVRTDLYQDGCVMLMYATQDPNANAIENTNNWRPGRTPYSYIEHILNQFNGAGRSYYSLFMDVNTFNNSIHWIKDTNYVTLTQPEQQQRNQQLNEKNNELEPNLQSEDRAESKEILQDDNSEIVKEEEPESIDDMDF